jgi:hypothetical protein
MLAALHRVANVGRHSTICLTVLKENRTMNDAFDIAPSPEYLAAKAELDAAQAEWHDMCVRHVWTGNFDDAAAKRNTERIGAAWDALRATPDQRYLGEIQKAERAADDRFHNNELARRGRQTAALSIETDFSQYATTAEALYNTGLSTRMLDNGFADPVVVVADMRRLTAAQLVQALRWFADEIEENGVSVYNGRAPIDGYCQDWWANELPDGTLRHRFYSTPIQG